MTRTAQRTNDIMKVLGLATVPLLPGSLVARLLGMNMIVPLAKDDPLSFWMLGGGVPLAIGALLVAVRRRRWLATSRTQSSCSTLRRNPRADSVKEGRFHRPAPRSPQSPSGRRLSELQLDDANQEQDHENDDDHADDPDATIS